MRERITDKTIERVKKAARDLADVEGPRRESGKDGQKAETEDGLSDAKKKVQAHTDELGEVEPTAD
jgi:hypothetical protein